MARMARRREDGFTYLGLIILVTIIGLVGAATLKADSLLRRAAAEEELLEIGAAFSAALQSYAAATPKGQPTQPATLQELLKDPRFPDVRRHLRKIFVDPVTGKAEWGLVQLGDRAGVLAVYSLSDAKPLKVANFDARFQNFENKAHISDWKFTANGQGIAQPVKPAAARGDVLVDPLPPPAAPAAPAGQAEPRDPPATPDPADRRDEQPPAGTPASAPEAAEAASAPQDGTPPPPEDSGR